MHACPQRGQAAWLTPAPGVPKEKRLGELEVMAAGHPHPFAQQAWIERRGRGPYPAGLVRSFDLGDCARQVVYRPFGSVRRRVVAEPTQPPAATLVRRHRNHHARHSHPRAAGTEEFEPPGRQPLTAPAVRPAAMFFWMMRKKMTTGSDVRIAPAMSGPQNVWR